MVQRILHSGRGRRQIHELQGINFFNAATHDALPPLENKDFEYLNLVLNNDG